MYSFLLALIYLTFISMGTPDSLLGSGWPVMHTTLNVPVSYMGAVTMIISGGTIVSSLLADKLTCRFGARYVTVFSVLLTVVALFGFSISNQFWMLLVFAVPYGLGGGAIDATLNNYIAVHYNARHMNWLHCFWGIGTIISPLIMGYAVTNLNWQYGYSLVGALQLVICLILFATLPVWNVNKDDRKQTQSSLGFLDVLKIKGVPFMLVGFFSYCASEAIAMQWASTYFTEVKGISSERAASFASLFFIGITAGRVVSGLISDRVGDRNMVRIGTCILSCGVLALLVPNSSYLVAVAAFVVIGFGCAPIYPCIIHSIPYNFGREHSGAIVGIQVASAYTGSTVIPPLFSIIGNAVGFSVLPIFLLFFFAVMIVMVETTFRITQKKKALS